MKGLNIPPSYDSKIEELAQEYNPKDGNPWDIMNPITKEVYKLASKLQKPVKEVKKDVEQKYKFLIGDAVSLRDIEEILTPDESPRDQSSKEDFNMSRNRKLVIFLDGTHNTPEELRHAGKKEYNPFKPPPITNVIRMLRGVRTDAGTKEPQVIGYFRGVGNEGNSVTKGVDCITGDGLSRIVLDAYRFISHNLEWSNSGQSVIFPEIYLFGFSRGAFAARALAGFMNEVGLIKKDHLSALPFIFSDYQKLFSEGKKFDSRALRLIEEITHKEYKYIPVKFIGVWDTVGALGLPIKTLSWKTTDYQKFYDTELGENVSHAFQALAIHELRSPFKPVFWTKKGSSTQTIEQVWFCGAHSNVGGGYEATGLSSYALDWMAYKAKKVGLELDLDYFKAELACRNIKEEIELSRNLGVGWFDVIKNQKIYSKLIRPVDRSKIDSYLFENFPNSKMQSDVKKEIKAHYSVKNRLDQNILHSDEIESFNKLDEAANKLPFTDKNETLS